MPINSSGLIAMGSGSVGQSINLELGKAMESTISMNDNDVRVLAGKVGINPISFSDFYGKPVTPSITPTRTITASITPTPSITTTRSITPTVTITPSITPTITMTPSITPTITMSPSISISPTPSTSKPPCYEYTATAAQSDLDSSDNGTVYFDYTDCSGNPQTLQRGVTDESFPVCARSVGSIYIFVFGNQQTAFSSYWTGPGIACG